MGLVLFPLFLLATVFTFTSVACVLFILKHPHRSAWVFMAVCAWAALICLMGAWF